MNRRILPVVLTMLFLVMLQLPAQAAEAPSVEAFYSAGVVTVSAEHLIAGEEYIIRVVDKVENYVVSMTQTEADESGYLSVSDTTGVLDNLSDHVVRINKVEGTVMILEGKISALFSSAYIVAVYSDGVVEVTGSGFEANTRYTVRVVNNADNSVKSMGQVTSDGSGKLSLSVITGALGNLSDYVVKVNISVGGTLVASDETITVKGGGGGGGGIDPPTAAESPEAPVVRKSDGTTTVTLTVKAQQGSDGKYTAAVTVENVESILNSITDELSGGQDVIVEFVVDSGSDGSYVEVVLENGAFAKLSGGGVSVKLITGLGTMLIDSQAKKSIDGYGSGDVRFGIRKLEEPEAGMPGALAGRPLYDISLRVGNKSISGIDSGIIHMSIPYALRQGEDKNAIVGYAVDGSGGMRLVMGMYNDNTGTVDFELNGFTRYAVAHNLKSFADVRSGEWYHGAVTFIAAREITEGTGNGMYGPGATITRGQFIVMLMRAYGIEPDAQPSDNFEDAGSTYYTNYLSVAKRLNIARGTGGNSFNPEGNINRQEMFTLLYNSLKLIGRMPESESGNTLDDFTDEGNIDSWAREAMEALVRAGKIRGSNSGINPLGTASRAEMAQILYNLMAE